MCTVLNVHFFRRQANENDKEEMLKGCEDLKQIRMASSSIFPDHQPVQGSCHGGPVRMRSWTAQCEFRFISFIISIHLRSVGFASPAIWKDVGDIFSVIFWVYLGHKITNKQTSFHNNCRRLCWRICTRWTIRRRAKTEGEGQSRSIISVQPTPIDKGILAVWLSVRNFNAKKSSNIT